MNTKRGEQNYYLMVIFVQFIINAIQFAAWNRLYSNLLLILLLLFFFNIAFWTVRLLKICVITSFAVLLPKIFNDGMFCSDRFLGTNTCDFTVKGLWTKLFWIDVLLYKNKTSQGTSIIFFSFKLY